MTAWAEGKHPRGRGGRFAPVSRADADVNLTPGMGDTLRFAFEGHPSPVLRALTRAGHAPHVTRTGQGHRVVVTLSDVDAGDPVTVRFVTLTGRDGRLRQERWQASTRERAVDVHRSPDGYADGEGEFVAGMERYSTVPATLGDDPWQAGPHLSLSSGSSTFWVGSETVTVERDSWFEDPERAYRVVTSELGGDGWVAVDGVVVERERVLAPVRQAGAAWLGENVDWAEFDEWRTMQAMFADAGRHVLNGGDAGTFTVSLEDRFRAGDLYPEVRELDVRKVDEGRAWRAWFAAAAEEWANREDVWPW